MTDESTVPTTVSLNITVLNEAAYPVVFSETGLPTTVTVNVGAKVPTWWVVLNGTNHSSESPGSIRFELTNGTGYSFVVGDDVGALAVPSSGTIDVAGVPEAKPVVFTAPSGSIGVRGWANITFQGGGGNYCIGDSGQVGTYPAWENVSLSAVARNGTSPYAYSWSFGDGSPNASGSRAQHTYRQYGSWQVHLTVIDGGGLTNRSEYSVRFIPPPDPVPVCPKPILGLPALEGYALLTGVAVGVIAASVVLAIWKRRRGKVPTQ